MAPALRRGLIVATPVAVAFLFDLELDFAAAGAISTGALLAGFVAFDAPARTRMIWQLFCTPAIGLAAALGALTGEPGWLAALTMTVFASVAGLLVAVSPRAAVAGMTCVLALLLAQGLEISPSEAPEALLLGGAGALAQVLTSAVVALVERTTEPVNPVAGTRSALRTVRANLSLRSTSLRHALRWGTALGLGVAAYHLIDVGRHGYWIPLTVLFVLRPAPDETVERIVMRAAGTVAGLALATLLAAAVGHHPWADALVIGLTAAFAFALLAIEYALFTASITAFVVLVAHALGQSALQAADQRAIATAIGIGIAAIAVVLWGSRDPRSRPA
ncbi:MAG: FUSC family protein [Solirubrobacterales bacterium]